MTDLDYNCKLDGAYHNAIDYIGGIGELEEVSPSIT